MSSEDLQTPLHEPAPRNIKTVGAIAIAVAVGIVIGGITGRVRDGSNLASETLSAAVPVVTTIGIEGRHTNEKIVFPGTLQAFYAAPIYARVNGYLKRWYVDIGAPVKSGQLLAEIETPDLDQQLEQALANLATAKANEALAEITARRWQSLLKTDSVSQQEADEKAGDYSAKQAIVAAAQANVDRLRALQSFKRITAPFDGVVTTRNTDVGALINAGQAGRELFTVSDVHKLRLYVSVPQSYVRRLQPNLDAELEVPEHPGQTFRAHMVADARAVNEASGTVLVQLEVDNANRTLIPGEYANVTFSLPADQTAVQIPASALIFRKEGARVAVLGADDKVAFRTVTIGRDFGTSLEIIAGLQAKDRVIDNPPDSLAEGETVRVKADAPAKPATAAAPAAPAAPATPATPAKPANAGSRP